jgi:hypothetical protein
MSTPKIILPAEREALLLHERALRERSVKSRRLKIATLTVCLPLLAALVWLNWDRRPSAPPWDRGPVFREGREGFRFSVPDGWTQTVRGAVPAGKIASERVLTEYKCMTCARPSVLQVSVADVPLESPLTEYVLKNTLTGEKWQKSAGPEEFTINSEPAVRITYVQREGKAEGFKEIVAFRRGERVYFFKGFYAGTDPKARTALRAAVDTIVW